MSDSSSLRERIARWFRNVWAFLRKIGHKLWHVFKLILLNKFIRCGVAMLRTVWLVVVVLLINYLFLNMMDQSTDLLHSLTINWRYSIFAFGCLLLYGVVVWYSTRIVFILKDQRSLVERVSLDENYTEFTGENDLLQRFVEVKKEIAMTPSEIRATHVAVPPSHYVIDERTLREFTRWTPVLLGSVPFFALLVALGKVEKGGLHQLALVALLVVYVGIAYQVKNYVDGPSADDRNINPHSFGDLRLAHRRAVWAGLIGGVFLVILATFWPTNQFLSSGLGPLSVVFLALTLWCLIANTFAFADAHFKTPFSVLCFVLLMFFNNNNHQISTIGHDEQLGSYVAKTDTQRILPYFRTWLTQLKTHRATRGRPTGPIPVYLIATEGGGIRSAYWTAAVLEQLSRTRPDFFRHVFAISGVSGGSVGAAVYTAQYRDRLRTPSRQFDLHRFFGRDYLSPLITAMLIPDMLQKFSPVGINAVDRARYLEDGWAKAYVDADVQQTLPRDPTLTPDQTLDAPFISLWEANQGQFRYSTPVLFLNATQVESGRKAILTPLTIRNDSNFVDVVDIQEEVYRHIPLKTAASMSARFPIVTPPATTRVVNRPSDDSANYVDGGYLDNSGTTTLLSVLSSITSNKAYAKLLAGQVSFRLLLIRNSSDVDPKMLKPVKGLYEFQAPLEAFFKAWDNSGGYRRYAVAEYVRGFGDFNRSQPDSVAIINSRVYPFSLDRQSGPIPLGWELSEQAEKNIREQAARLYRDLGQARRGGVYKGLMDGL